MRSLWEEKKGVRKLQIFSIPRCMHAFLAWSLEHLQKSRKYAHDNGRGSRSKWGVNCNIILMARTKKSHNAVWEPSDKSQRMPALRGLQQVQRGATKCATSGNGIAKKAKDNGTIQWVCHSLYSCYYFGIWCQKQLLGPLSDSAQYNGNYFRFTDVS